VVLAVILLVFGTYAFTSEGPVYQYAMQVIIAMLICHLLWRVETLSCLTPATSSKEEERGEEGGLKVEGGGRIEGGEARNIIGPLLKQYCEEPQLYLQYDISITQLAQLIGINRSS
jgi:hypothetical protein